MRIIFDVHAIQHDLNKMNKTSPSISSIKEFHWANNKILQKYITLRNDIFKYKTDFINMHLLFILVLYLYMIQINFSTNTENILDKKLKYLIKRFFL